MDEDWWMGTTCWMELNQINPRRLIIFMCYTAVKWVNGVTIDRKYSLDTIAVTLMFLHKTILIFDHLRLLGAPTQSPYPLLWESQETKWIHSRIRTTDLEIRLDRPTVVSREKLKLETAKNWSWTWCSKSRGGKIGRIVIQFLLNYNGSVFSKNQFSFTFLRTKCSCL